MRWQPRPHAGLGAAWANNDLSPNTMFEHFATRTGRLSCPLSADDYVELLNPKLVGVHRYGINHNNQTLDAARKLRQDGRDRLQCPPETDHAFAKLVQQHMPRATALFPEHQQVFIDTAQWCFYKYVKHETDAYMWTLPRGMQNLQQQRQQHTRGESP